jgi:hypothetical protein
MATRDDSDTSVVRIVVCWRLVDFTGNCLVCELRRTADGLQVCCLRPNGDADRVESIDDARSGIILAEQWKAWYLADGWEPRSSSASAEERS